MNKLITVTRKGQTTLPSAIRTKLGLGANGGILQLSFDESKRELTITKPISASELGQRISQYIKPGTKPIFNVDEYYQANRNKK